MTNMHPHSAEPTTGRLGRRTLLMGGLGVAAAAAGSAVRPAAASAGPAASDGWSRAERIRGRVRAPQFPQRQFSIVDHGAVEGGEQICTDAIAAAIHACHAAGGGHVIVPTGTFLTGPVRLESNVDLHLADGATLLFSTHPADYLPVVLTRFEGMELMNYSPLIYARGCTGIAVTGKGTLDGQADNRHWWPWKGKEEYGWTAGQPEQSAARRRLGDQVEDGVPVGERVYGDGDCLRPSFIQPYQCTNVWIQGVSIRRSPMWEVHPVLCRNVLVDGVTIDTKGPNNDGCDPECCSMVVIQNCTFTTGDDCIAIKAGRNEDGRRLGVPCSDLLIEHCTMADGHGGVTIGSEMSGGVENVFVQNCIMSSPELNIALRFKTNSVRGGRITGFFARNISVGTVKQAVIDVDFTYEEGAGHGHNPNVEGIAVTNLNVGQAEQALNVSGYPDDHIRALALTNVNFGRTVKAPRVQYADDVTMTNVLENGAPLKL